MLIIHWCNNEDVSNYDDDDDDDGDNGDGDDDGDNEDDDDDDDDNDSTPTELLTNGQRAPMEENQGCMMICFTVKFYL